MNNHVYSRIRFTIFATLSAMAMATHETALAEADWSAFTVDNDFFVATDNGYTNGLYYSRFDTPRNNQPKPGFLARAMLWSMPDERKPVSRLSGKTIGQTMMTPDDITLEEPEEGDLPYAGLLFYSDTYIERHEDGYADKIGVTIGVIGDYSFAEESQTFVHDLIDDDEPEGWDTQLDDEIVFQFSRGRNWQGWKSSSGRQDLVLGYDAALGTISSYASVSAMWRYGIGLDRTFGSALLASGRVANPLAIDNGWYFYAGISPRYVANVIFLDGNTFDDDDDDPIDFDKEQVSVSVGFSYARSDWSLTYAISDLNIIDEDDDRTDTALDEYSQYGTLTFAWRHD